jgi:hypothetical protein
VVLKKCEKEIVWFWKDANQEVHGFEKMQKGLYGFEKMQRTTNSS